MNELERAVQLVKARAGRAAAAAEAMRLIPASRSARSHLQLEIWPEKLRCMPNDLARCALFTAGGKKEPRYNLSPKQQIAASIEGGMSLWYRGEELRQDDMDVWLQFVHLARLHPLGDIVDVSYNALLCALGWGRGADRYARVRACVERLTAAVVWLNFNEEADPGLHLDAKKRRRRKAHSVGYHMIINSHLIETDEETTPSKLMLRLDPNMMRLFSPGDVSLVEWEQRLGLGALPKWLHSFYSTHREPFAYRVETLRRLCGSRTRRVAHFRNALFTALDTLTRCGFLASWQHDPVGDTVLCRRAARGLASGRG